MQFKKLLKHTAWITSAAAVLLNALAFSQAWRLTHYRRKASPKLPDSLTPQEQRAMGLWGVDQPRPENVQLPRHPHETVYIEGRQRIEAWYIRAAQPRGTVLMFHGYTSHKSTLLDKAEVLVDVLQYDVLLVDFPGSGGSEGDKTSIGYHEAQDVQTVFDHMQAQNVPNLILFGTSMGAVSILKALHDYALPAQAIIIECPFGTMYQAISNRFENLGIPQTPMAGLMVLWGGLLHGFWAFGHQPVRYAPKVSCPTLLLWGEKDEKVRRHEIEAVFAQLAGPKTLVTLPEAGHADFMAHHPDLWTDTVAAFLGQVPGNRHETQSK